MIELVRASPAHVGTIANRMRDIDQRECEAMGRTPKQALRAGVVNSAEAWTAKVDGRPEAMLGLVVTSALGGQGTPWMLGTDVVYQHGRGLLFMGRRIVAHWRDSTPHLSNYVSVENVRAIRLLRAWGFKLSEEVILFAGTEFITFRTD